ncbi:MAG: AAA family ATPase [Deltaproteobacteria bacterium]|jgi:hypothetical protein|nr:AAA family ATPase [Deltaproteobacteria bacterium]
MIPSKMTPNLPVGDQSFAEIIDQNLLCADKTRYIYNLVKKGYRSYYLARPRGFGKSLLISSMKEIFSGNEKLFENLWIGKSDYEFKKYPVVHLNFSGGSSSPEELEKNIAKQLYRIADEAGVDIEARHPFWQLTDLILALCPNRSDLRVVVLMDDYDAPIVENLGDRRLAEANAEVLSNFFNAFTHPYISERYHFCFAAGETRYALSGGDGYLNHLTDISLCPEYAGICGFALEEFDSLFGDRLEGTLTRLQEKAQMPPSANVSDLKKEIFRWYDGYSWDGDQRVLNPYSTLQFFENEKFDRYWSKLDRPAYVAALFRKRPLAFLQPFISYQKSDLERFEMNYQGAARILFRGGFLTIDKISNLKVEHHFPPFLSFPTDSETTIVDSYSFKFPNDEVADSYYKDCYKYIFGLNKDVRLETKGEELKLAILDRDEKAVGQIFRDYFFPIPYFERFDGEDSFHALVQVIFSALGFKVISELAGADSRLDLCVKLTEETSVVIELKYCRIKGNLTPAQIVKHLTSVALNNIPIVVTDESLARAARNKMSPEAIRRVMTNSGQKHMSKADENAIMALASATILSAAEYRSALATAARNNMDDDELQTALKKERITQGDIEDILSRKNPSPDEIEAALTKAVNQALKDIESSDYRSLIKSFADEIICLGLALHEQGAKVKAAFGSKA